MQPSSFFLLFLLALLSQVLGQLKFPLTFGGFSANTAIDKVYIDSAQNMIIAGQSSELTLVSASGDKFVIYLERDASVYKWTTKLPTANIPGSALAITQRTGSDQAAILFYSTSNRQDLVILDMSSGAVLKHLSIVSPSGSIWYGSGSKSVKTIMYIGTQLLLMTKNSSQTLSSTTTHLGYVTIDPTGGSIPSSPITVKHISGLSNHDFYGLTASSDFIAFSLYENSNKLNNILYMITSPSISIGWLKTIQTQTSIEYLSSLTSGVD